MPEQRRTIHDLTGGYHTNSHEVASLAALSRHEAARPESPPPQQGNMARCQCQATHEFEMSKRQARRKKCGLSMFSCKTCEHLIVKAMFNVLVHTAWSGVAQ